jgi:hypothetical protein
MLQGDVLNTLLSQTTRELKVTGAAGHMSSAQKQGPNVSENELAIGGTNVWKTAAIDDNTSFAFFFEVPGKESVPRGKNAMIQFQTLYQHSNGQTIMRVTTLAYAFGDPSAGKLIIIKHGLNLGPVVDAIRNLRRRTSTKGAVVKW